MNRALLTATALAYVIAAATALGPLTAEAFPHTKGIDSGALAHTAWYDGESILIGIISVPTGQRQTLFDLSDDQKTIFIHQYNVRQYNVHPGIESRLTAYDISDLRSPRLLSTLKVPALTSGSNAEIEHRGDHLFLFGSSGDATKGASVAIFDLSDASHPQLLSTLLGLHSLHLDLSADGKTITDYTGVFDVSDPAHPARIGDAVQEPPSYGRSHSQLPGFPPISGLDVIDQTTDRALTADDDSLYRVWDITTPGHPRLEREIPCVQLCGLKARLLRVPEAVIVLDTPGLDILATEPVEVGGPALLRLHDKFAKLYAVHSSKAPDPYLMLPRFTTAMLEDAGVAQLANGPMPNISAEERERILSDYGNWKLHTGWPELGVPALKRVTEASPMNAQAWRNLGDAARFGLGHIGSYLEKRDMAEVAMNAYDRYFHLTGNRAPGAGEFMAFNPANAPGANVCAFAERLFENNRDDHEFLDLIGNNEPIADETKLDIRNDGRLVSMRLAPGLIPPSIDPIPGVNVFEPDHDLSDIDVLPFRDGKYYVLYRVNHRPYEVALANVGTVCRFHP